MLIDRKVAEVTASGDYAHNYAKTRGLFLRGLYAIRRLYDAYTLLESCKLQASCKVVRLSAWKTNKMLGWMQGDA